MLFNFVSIFVGCVRIDPDIAVAVDIDVSRYLELLEYGADGLGFRFTEGSHTMVLLAAGILGCDHSTEIVIKVSVYVNSPIWYCFAIFGFLSIHIFTQFQDLSLT